AAASYRGTTRRPKPRRRARSGSRRRSRSPRASGSSRQSLQLIGRRPPVRRRRSIDERLLSCPSSVGALCAARTVTARDVKEKERRPKTPTSCARCPVLSLIGGECGGTASDAQIEARKVRGARK